MSEISVVIAAAGESARWNREIAPHKQMARLPDGRFLIQRTIDMLIAEGYRNIFVATVHDEIRKAVRGADLIFPRHNHTLSDTVLSCAEVFSNRVVILLGDVFFSEEALREIMQCQDAIRLFGKKDYPGATTGSGSRGGEIYALSFSGDMKEAVIAALEKTAMNAALQRCRLRPVRAVLRWRNGSLHEHLQRVYPPWAPKFLRKKGVRASRFWCFWRIVTGQRKGAKRYGKLWGLYLELIDTPVFYGDVLCSPVIGAPLFAQIDDITRDIDFEEDYRELLSRLSRESFSV